MESKDYDNSIDNSSKKSTWQDKDHGRILWDNGVFQEEKWNTEAQEGRLLDIKELCQLMQCPPFEVQEPDSKTDLIHSYLDQISGEGLS